MNENSEKPHIHHIPMSKAAEIEALFLGLIKKALEEAIEDPVDNIEKLSRVVGNYAVWCSAESKSFSAA